MVAAYNIYFCNFKAWRGILFFIVSTGNSFLVKFWKTNIPLASKTDLYFGQRQTNVDKFPEMGNCHAVQIKMS